MQADFESGAGIRTKGSRLTGVSNDPAPLYTAGGSTAAVGEALKSSLLLQPRRASQYAPLDSQADALLEKLRCLYSHTEHGSQRQQVRGVCA